MECDNLRTVTFSDGCKSILRIMNRCGSVEKINIPDSVTTICSYAFQNCTSLQTLTIPETVTAIETYAFAGSGLINIIIPDSVTSMGSYDFYNCKSLVNVKLPSTRENIMSYMFAGCTSLEKITLPSTVTTIQDHAFQNCEKLKTIDYSESLASINKYAFENCDSLETVTIPSTVGSLDEGCYYDCDGITSISISNSVTTLGKKMFYDCDVLKNVELGTGITSIPTSAFEHCDELETIALPYRIKKIEASAFKNCIKLVSITIPRSVTSIDITAFSYPDKLTIYGVSGTYTEEFATANNIKFVAIDKPATEISLNQTEVILSQRKTVKLVLNITPSDFTDEVSWKSADTSIATIDDSGLITAKAVGDTTIKVIVGSLSASCKVTVIQPITGLSLNSTSRTMNALDTYQLKATTSPNTAYVKEIKWESSAPGVASVDENGLVTAYKKGTAQITVTAYDYDGSISKTCNVTVNNNATIAKTVSEMESPHNYSNKCTDYWVYTLDGAQNIDVTFDERTEIEDGFDYLYIFDKNKNQIGKYTGKALSGKTVTISGNVVIIQIVSDDSGNEWGFKVTEVRESEGPPPDPEEDQKAADAVANQIRNMDTTDSASVEAARQAYEDLTPEQKELIDSSVLKILTDAETAIEEAKEKEKQDLEAAQAVMDIINQLDVNDPDSVEAARAAYNALNPDQKKLIDTSTLKILTDAEKEIAEAEKAKEDQEAAQSAINVINQIDVNDPSSIEAARKAYNALTADQKKLIDASVLKTLKDAEETIKQERSIILVTSIKLTGLSKMIAAGKKLTLKATVLPTTATNKKLKWTSSNTNLAKVTQSGVITINKNAGGKTVTIKATATDGSKKTITWNIKVMKGAVKKITVKGYKKTLKAGKTMKLKAVVKVTKGKPVNKKLKWTSSNKKWATVTQNGKVKALKNGKGKTVKITVESTDGTNKKVVKKIKIK